MTKYTRVTAKIFGETASTSNTPKEIGQFGSAKAGTYNATGDVATIQNLTAWSNGWIDAVTPTQQFPSLPEMTGVHKVLSYQEAYLLQQGIPEWDSATTYYENGFASKNGKIYVSLSDSNLNNDPESDTVNWADFTINLANTSLSNLTSTSSTNFDGQWVISWETLAENVNYAAGAVVTYSLSNYLPNDNYTYECLFCFYGRTGSTSGDIVSGSLYSGTGADVTTNLKAYVGRAQTRTASTVICSGSAILPIKPTDRAVTYSNEDGIGTSGGSGLKVAGYRRIGTNS